MQFEHRNQYDREVCGWLQVGYIAYSWSYCWFQHTNGYSVGFNPRVGLIGGYIICCWFTGWLYNI